MQFSNGYGVLSGFCFDYLAVFVRMSHFIHLRFTQNVVQFCVSLQLTMPLHSAQKPKYQEFTIPCEADTISECQAFETSSCINSNVLRKITSVSDVKHSEKHVYRWLRFESCRSYHGHNTFSCAIQHLFIFLFVRSSTQCGIF